VNSSIKSITKRERDCLMVLAGNLEDRFPLRLNEISRLLRVKPPTALGIIRRLEKKGLTDSRGGMVKLTERGGRTVSDIILIHRTLETLLCRSGLNEDEACREASKIDYILDEEDAEIILRNIGDPKTCPHGRPIRLEV